MNSALTYDKFVQAVESMVKLMALGRKWRRERPELGTPIMRTDGYDLMARPERMAYIDFLLSKYPPQQMRMAPSLTAVYETMADAILMEELTDPNLHKVMHNEYPILSEHQLLRRRSGKYTARDGSNMRGEVDISKVEAVVGTDRRAHGAVSRRKRSNYENNFVDDRTRGRTYDKEREPGEIHSYKLDAV